MPLDFLAQRSYQFDSLLDPNKILNRSVRIRAMVINGITDAWDYLALPSRVRVEQGCYLENKA